MGMAMRSTGLADSMRCSGRKPHAGWHGVTIAAFSVHRVFELGRLRPLIFFCLASGWTKVNCPRRPKYVNH
jgi:hypothetical protein